MSNVAQMARTRSRTKKPAWVIKFSKTTNGPELFVLSRRVIYDGDINKTHDPADLRPFLEQNRFQIYRDEPDVILVSLPQGWRAEINGSSTEQTLTLFDEQGEKRLYQQRFLDVPRRHNHGVHLY